jgi:DNA-binding NtrC family response regulator
MLQAHTILIVHHDPKVVARLASQLRVAGDVSTATSFDHAKAILTTSPPSVLVTGVRLGEYNGLHLIIRSRIDHPATAAILISDRRDPVLEAEATLHGTAYVSNPGEEDRLLSLVLKALSRTGV